MAAGLPSTADAVVVGGGTVGGWCAWFLRRSGIRRVALVDRRSLGSGASRRAAGIVRTQGGTEAAVRLGMWTRDFYEGQRDTLSIDSGFVRQGYFLPVFDDTQESLARQRLDMQRRLGLDVRWLDPSEAESLNPTMARGVHRGGTYAPGDGYIDPGRNVSAYAHALADAAVEVFEDVTVLDLDRDALGVRGVRTDAGDITTRCVIVTGGPDLARIGQDLGLSIPAGGVRHQVAVTAPHSSLAPDELPMVFDIGAGLYWRPEDGGLLFGMSNPDEPPGPAHELDWAYLERMRQRLAALVPISATLGLRKVWAATIDFTPDHLPIIGPALDTSGPIPGVTVASAGGHGMMWGPAVARVAADLATSGTTGILDVSDLGLSRFDDEGRSRLDPDPVALPFPQLSGHREERIPSS